MKVCKLELNGGGPWMAFAVDPLRLQEGDGLLEELRSFLDEAGPGESATLEVVEMTTAEFDSMPDFQGW